MPSDSSTIDPMPKKQAKPESKRPVGRPMMGAEPLVSVSAMVPKSVADEIERAAQEDRRSRSQQIALLVEEALRARGRLK